MLIVAYSKLHVDRLLRQGNIAGGVALGVLLLGILLFSLLYPWNRKEEVNVLRARPFVQGAQGFSYEAIGTGALALNPQQTYGWVAEIARELIIIAHNSRPDVSQREANILIALKHGQEQRNIVNGKTLYFEPGDKGLIFSDAPQSLWAKPILLDNGGVLVEVGRKLGTLEAPHSEEKGQFVVQPKQVAAKSSARSPVHFAAALKSARGWGQDMLIQKYGGREFQEWKEKYKVIFSQGNVSYACFVSAGDRLVWKGGEWRVSEESEEIALNLPVARVQTASASGVEITAWDESGFYPVHVVLPLENPVKFNAKMEGMPSSIRLRTATQVSCLLGKKRLILRQGDWLLKTSSGWRNLRKKEEVENYLTHRLQGELFIFDILEKEQGKWVMKGHLFDEMRTQVHPIALPIDVEKKQGKAGGHRKLPFVTKSTLPLWFSSETVDMKI